MESKFLKIIFYLGIFHGLFSQLIFAQDDLYSFEVEEFHKKIWEWKAELSLTASNRIVNQDSIYYASKFKNEDQSQYQSLNLQLIVDSRWDWDWSRFYLKGESWVNRSNSEGFDREDAILREAYWQIAQYEPHIMELGKRQLHWGKGYAFNPVAFLERSKNPEDPESDREGLWMTQVIWLTGALSAFDNSSLTLIYLPIREDVNQDFNSETDQENAIGLKAYALLGTTDLDFYYVNWSEAQNSDWGIDFAANLTSNFEIHGEYSQHFSNDGGRQQSLTGIRYLTENDITLIAENYFNSSGLTAEESTFLYNKFQGLPPSEAKPIALQLQKSIVNQNYGFLKVSIKEPFNIVNLTPALVWLTNLDDKSSNLISQFNYDPIADFSLQFSWQHFSGPANSQFGEYLKKENLELKLTRAF